MAAISKPLPITQSWAIGVKDFETGEIEWICYTERKHETTYGNLQWSSQLKLEHFTDPIYSEEENALFKKRPSKGEKIMVSNGGPSGMVTGRAKSGRINRQSKNQKNASIQQPK